MPLSALDTVKQFYEAAKKGDVDTVRAMLHNEMYAEEAPSLSYGGVYRGADEFMKLSGALRDAWEEFDFEIDEFLDAGSHIIAMVRLRGRLAATGRLIDTKLAEFLTVKDGKILSLIPYYWDTAAIAAR
jgi:ketosteroid isomerase-like protein